MCEELRAGSTTILKWAKSKGQREIEEADLDEVVSGEWSESKLRQFSAELYTVLLSKTAGDYRAAVLGAQPAGTTLLQRGLEAWRAISYEAAPHNQVRAFCRQTWRKRNARPRVCMIMKTMGKWAQAWPPALCSAIVKGIEPLKPSTIGPHFKMDVSEGAGIHDIVGTSNTRYESD